MASKKPKGLTITRKKDKYIFKWKKGETYADGQRLICGYVQVTKKGNKSTKTYWEQDTVKLSGSKTDYTLKVPTSYTDITHVYFKVRGKAHGEAWSDWENETFQVKDPKNPTVSASWDSATPNKTTFTFTAKDEEHQPYDHIVWQTILVQNCPSDYKAESLWKSATKNTKTGTSGTLYNTAESALTGSWARIVRAQAVGQGGASEWKYAWHVYAQPNAPYNVSVDAQYDASNQATDLVVKWSAMAPAMQRPIDTTKIQYCIGVPTTGFGLPTGASWTDVATPVNTSLNIWQARLAGEVQADECLFIKVTTVHDLHETGSDFVCAYKRALTAPTLGTITPTKATHTIAVAVTNGSQNPDSKTAITYRDPATGKVGIVGVIAHGGTSMNVLVPAWEDNAGTIGAFAFVGESSQQKSTPHYVYSVNSVVESDTVWASSTRTAPTISAVLKDEDAVNVAWNWSWADATNAELSWADRSDAWESTSQPSTYVVNNNQQASWNITGLDSGKTYYFRVRLFYGENDENFYSDYSNTAVVDMTQPPEKPVLELSDTIVPVDGTITASWQNYEKQTYAELIETVSGVDTVRAEVGSGSTVEFSPADFGWSNDTQHILSVRVYLDTNTGSLKSDTVAVNVASALECVIAQDSLVYEEQELNPETYTGNPAQFNGGTEETLREITSAKVALEPHQAGTPWQSSLQTKPYMFKAAPQLNHTYNSVLPTLTGGTVAWNQLINQYANSGSSSGVTFTKNNDGSWSVSGTPEDNNVFYNVDYYGHEDNYITVGHVYYLPKCTNDTRPIALAVFGETTDRYGYGPSGTYTANGIIFKAAGVKTGRSWARIQVSNLANTNIGTVKVYPQFFDLTQMFGTAIADRAYTLESGTAGAGVAWLRSYGFFTKPYYAYNAGTLESACVNKVTRTGFNQWDEQWEVGTINTSSGQNETNGNYFRSKNYIQVLPNTTYYYKTSDDVVYLFYYDDSKSYIGYETVKDGTKTTNANARYLRIVNVSRNSYSASSKPICINLHWDGERDGEYEPYVAHEYAIDDVELRGVAKLDINNDIYYDGDVYESDGTVTRRYGSIDLGTLSWTKSSSGNKFYATISTPYALGYNVSMICAKYIFNGIGNNTSGYYGDDKTIRYFGPRSDSASLAEIYIHDEVYSDATAFTTAMNGVYLVYELATETTDEADSYVSPQYCDDFGTEYYTDAKVASSTRDVEVPVGQRSTYADIYEISGTDEVTVKLSGEDQSDYDTYTASLGTTVYGGDADLVKGQGQKCPYYASYNGETLTGAWLSDRDPYVPGTTPSIGAQVVNTGGTLTDFTFTAQDINAVTGQNNVWSEQGDVTVRIADAVESGYILDELPLTVTVTGAGTAGNTTMKIVRAENYAMERPDGKDYNGYEGDLIVQKVQSGEDQMTVDLANLVGRFDDGAKYRIVATIQDELGQRSEAVKDFTVQWSHQAVIATGTAVIDGDIAKITPTKPNAPSRLRKFP